MKEFLDVFLEELPGFPPMKEVSYKINLISRETAYTKDMLHIGN